MLFVPLEVAREEGGRMDEGAGVSCAWRRQNEALLRPFPLNLVGARGAFDFVAVARENMLATLDARGCGMKSSWGDDDRQRGIGK